MKPIRLRLELKSEYLEGHDRVMLKRYGESPTGDSIIRELIIPSDMMLNNLHYAIQKVFGWHNSHLRRFYLEEDIFDTLTQGTVKGWSELVGVLFQPPSTFEGDLFWNDDYQESMNFKSWLKRKYTGPYWYQGTIENYEAAQEDVQNMLHESPMIEVRESVMDFMARRKDDENDEVKVLKKAPMIDLTLEELNQSIFIETAFDNLLERLKIDDILAYQNEDIPDDSNFPCTNTLLYEYDFGDGWTVHITKHEDYEDLIKAHHITHKEVEEAKQEVLQKYKPVCIYQGGLSVLDDVGNLHGFARLLEELYEYPNTDEVKGTRTWARSMGWNATKKNIKTLI